MRELTIKLADDDRLPELIEAYAAHNQISMDHAIQRLLVEGLNGFGLQELTQADFAEATSVEELFQKMGITQPK